MTATTAITGAGGFLGWHTRAALRSLGRDSTGVSLGDAFDLADATRAIEGADRLIHLAGVNRGTDAEVADGNRRFAEQVAASLRGAANPPAVVVNANSTQATNGSVYGEAKRAAAATLASVCAELGLEFRDVLIPNIFGEHGRPNYNSVFATFSTRIAAGDVPQIAVDRALDLVHAQDVADVLIGITDDRQFAELATSITVAELAALLGEMATRYRTGEIPDLTTRFRRDVFNSYRSYTVPESIPISLTRNADARGSFFEIAKVRASSSQTSFSTTVPGVTRGEHFHRRKIERFVVLSGSAEIRLRRLFDDEVLRFQVSGDEPVAIDMPTMWSHAITNTGNGPLLTAFWTNDLFDPDNPDTFAETV